MESVSKLVGIQLPLTTKLSQQQAFKVCFRFNVQIKSNVFCLLKQSPQLISKIILRTPVNPLIPSFVAGSQSNSGKQETFLRNFESF